MYKGAPYILMTGISFIVFSGLAVVETYDSYDTYSDEALIYLVFGICLTLIAYMFIQHGRKRDHTDSALNEMDPGRDHREFIKKLWAHKENLGAGLIVFCVVLLGAMFIFDSQLAGDLLQLSMSLGLIGFAFLYIMKDGDQEQEEDDLQPKSRTMRYILRLIDYRQHPFSVALILFTLIVLSLILSKHFGFIVSMETGGNPRYVMSFPSGMRLMAGLIFACTFVFIIQNCDFFGIRRAEQGEEKVMQIHFAEIILCGAMFLIWPMLFIFELL